MAVLGSTSQFLIVTMILTIYLFFNCNSVNGNSFPLENQQPQQQQQKIDNDFLRSSKSINSRSSSGASNFGFVGPRVFQISRSKIPIELLELIDNGDTLDGKLKRYDDDGQGHYLRFGKRGVEDNFDDYGHMRFGRSV